MAYRVMQQTEDGMEFCANGGFATVDSAESWLQENAANWPESSFWVEADYQYDPADDMLEDVPW